MNNEVVDVEIVKAIDDLKHVLKSSGMLCTALGRAFNVKLNELIDEFSLGGDQHNYAVAPAETCDDPWRDEDEDYPLADWRYDVANNDTRLGYWDWVEHNKESAADDDA